MDCYFVYSSGGGAGDWGGIDRIFRATMPEYFKNHILLKFGDIFFNHRSSNSIVKPRLWESVNDAKSWLIGNTGDESIRSYRDMIMDVGTTKIVSFITSDDSAISARQLIGRFDRILSESSILEKYSQIVVNSDICNAVTFDIPNLFKVRSQIGNVARDLFSEGNCKQELIAACARYANIIYHNTGEQADKLLTIVNLAWTQEDTESYMSQLDYIPTKIGVGGAAFYSYDDMGEALRTMNAYLNFPHYQRVHFLGCGGLRRAGIIKDNIGNYATFSVDNTTPYNRVIDGSVNGGKQSGYFDYLSGELYRVNPGTKETIMQLHRRAVERGIAYFTIEQMNEIIEGILAHQSDNSSSYTYECRAKLIIHNFHVFKYNAE